MWVGPDWRKKLLKKRSGSYFRYKKFMIFQRSHFNVFLMTLAFYLIFLWKLIYMFGFILLSSLQYFISLERLVTWSRAFCSLWVHLVYVCDEENQISLYMPNWKKEKVSADFTFQTNYTKFGRINLYHRKYLPTKYELNWCYHFGVIRAKRCTDRQTERQTDRNKLITITLSYRRALTIVSGFCKPLVPWRSFGEY